MQEIQAYRCADGAIFTSAAKAHAHETDLLGQALTDLVRLGKLDISRNQEFRGVERMLENREDVRRIVQRLLDVLDN